MLSRLWKIPSVIITQAEPCIQPISDIERKRKRKTERERGGGERERERDRQTDRQTDIGRSKEIQREM